MPDGSDEREGSERERVGREGRDEMTENPPDEGMLLRDEGHAGTPPNPTTQDTLAHTLNAEGPALLRG